MKKVTLKFKKEDFNKPYGDSSDCAITTALQRAGVDGRDVGSYMRSNIDNEKISDPKTYDKMLDKILPMYLYVEGGSWGLRVMTPTKPRNCQVTILLDID